MPQPAETEIRTIEGREIKIHWKSPRFGEWLAWCYVPGPNHLHHEGAGFEARAATPEEAKSTLVEKAAAHIRGSKA